jgi:ElaB/YqjD/DUF883 family membrane-anchored ribosome-binding protein
MDDKTRGVGAQRDEMTGRADEATRNLDPTASGTIPPSRTTTRANTAPRRAASSSRGTTPSANADGLDRETDERTRALQAEIADTREELSETLEAIQERLRPGNIMSNATETVKEKARESVRGLADNAGERASGMMRQSRRTAGDVVENVKNNPLPALMIGAGVAWLLMDRSRRDDSQQWNTRQHAWSSNTTSGFGVDEDDADYSDIDYRRDIASQRRGISGTVSDRASNVVDSARDRWQRTTRSTTNGLQRLMRDNPLLVGATAIVVGAAVGAALPETERENEFMGETRDSVVNQAQELAQNTASTVKEVASSIPDQVTEAVTAKVTGSKA